MYLTLYTLPSIFANMALIMFNTADTIVTLRNRKKLKIILAELFIFNNVDLQSLNYVFCSDEYLLSINREFLQHDFYTDTITFNLSVSQASIIGEVYISVDRIKDNALTNKVSFKEELHRVIFHGALHLCGYKDKKKNDIIAMRNAENFWLKNYLRST